MNATGLEWFKESLHANAGFPRTPAGPQDITHAVRYLLESTFTNGGEHFDFQHAFGFGFGFGFGFCLCFDSAPEMGNPAPGNEIEQDRLLTSLTSSHTHP